LKEKIPGVTVQPDESQFLHWTGIIEGPEPYYTKGNFKLDITFPLDYPFKAPQVRFNFEDKEGNWEGDPDVISLPLFST
jgi:ubiquitin-protein ligase